MEADLSANLQSVVKCEVAGGEGMKPNEYHMLYKVRKTKGRWN